MRRLAGTNTKAQFGHIAAAVYFDRLHLCLGIPVIALTTLVGTSVFATLQHEAGYTLNAYLRGERVRRCLVRHSDLSSLCRACGKTSGERREVWHLRRELEQNLAFAPATPEERQKYIDSLRQRWDRLSEECPTAPQQIWDSAYLAKTAGRQEERESAAPAP